MTTVDVVVPCYNYARYLAGCVQSVTSQRDVNVRVLVIDDCSPDETADVGCGLADADGRVAYLRNDENLGLIGAANRGVMDWARSDYVVLLSADDQLTPGALSRATRLMDAHPQVSMAYGMALMSCDDGRALSAPDPRDAPYCIVPGERFLRYVCEVGNGVPSPCAVMRTRVQHDIGGYDPRFPHTSDLDMWMRAALAGPIGVIDALHGLYRWHGSNMSAAYHERPLGDCSELIQTCREFERRFGDRVPNFGRWREAMERRFGEQALWTAGQSFADPSVGAWQDSLAFARTHLRGYRRTPVFWKFMIRRALGRRVCRALFGHRERPGVAPSDLHGRRVGWWPADDSAESGLLAA
jgi:GT2 family glycosyltransferase